MSAAKPKAATRNDGHLPADAMRRYRGKDLIRTRCSTFLCIFSATIGGLGLTGLIAWVEIEVIPIASTMMEVETIPFGTLDEFFTLAAESDGTFDYTVAWIDCLAKGSALGRGILSRARHAGSGPLAVRK